MPKITPCLWFDNQAEEAGTVLTIDFEIEGQKYTALNGGPVFKFNEAILFVVQCRTQKEMDYYWEKLSEAGDKRAQQCGWLKDKYASRGRSFLLFWARCCGIKIQGNLTG